MIKKILDQVAVNLFTKVCMHCYTDGGRVSHSLSAVKIIFFCHPISRRISEVY